TSLPSPYGIGDLGPSAYAWVDVLARAHQTWWQILPLGPTGFGDSPYQSFSAFAGNPYLVSPHSLIEDGLLDTRDVPGAMFPNDRVEFGPVINFKNRLLDQAWDHFQTERGGALRASFERFVAEEAGWLDDYALFMAIKDSHQGRCWQHWPAPVKMRDADCLKKIRTELAQNIGAHQFR